MPSTSSQCTMRTGRSHTRRIAGSFIRRLLGGRSRRSHSRSRGGTRARWWNFDLRQFAAVLLVSLGSEKPRDLEALGCQEIRRTSTARRVVGYRHDRAALRNPVELLFEVLGLNAQIHGESADFREFIWPAQVDDQ